MKKYSVFLLTIMLLHSVLSAQDYRNIITSGTAFYSGTTNEPGFLSGVKAESKAPVGNGDTLILVANTIRKHTPTTLLDTLGGIFGRTIIKRINGWFLFMNAMGDTIFLNSNAGLNESWKFCSLPEKGKLVATCSSILSISLLGTNEMVKEITFQAKDSNGVNILNFYNGKTMQLGQQFGLTRVYDLYHMPDSTGVFTLEGKNDPAIGFQGMTNHDLYEFAVGDEFHFQGLTNFLWGNHPSTKDYKIIRKVLAKQVAQGQGSVTYTFEYCKEEIEFNPILGPSTTYSHDTILISYPYGTSLADPLVNWLPEQFTHTGYRYYSTLQHLVPGKPAYGKRDDRYACCWTNYPYYQMYIRDEREYASGLGQVHYKNYWTYFDLVKYDYEDLVYYKKGNEQWGSPVYTSCSAMVPSFAVTPTQMSLNYPAGSSAILNINTNQAWAITSPDTMFNYSPTVGYQSGTVTVSAKSTNLNGWELTAMLYIDCPIGHKIVNITQQPNPVVTISSNPDTLVLGWNVGTQDTLFISSNTTWELYTPEWFSWITVSDITGRGNGMIIFHSTASNDDANRRMALFTLKSTAGNRNLVIIQSGHTTGIKGKPTDQIRISPNPVETTATLSFPGLAKNQEKQIALFDFTGRVVFKDTFSSDSYRFNRETLPSGIYIVKVTFRKEIPPMVVKVMLE